MYRKLINVLKGVFVSLVMGIFLLGFASSDFKDIPTLIREGNKYFNNGQYEKAARSYKKALAMEERADAIYNLAITYHHRLNYHAKAVHYYQRFLELEPEAPEAGAVKEWLIEAEHKVFPDKKLPDKYIRPKAADILLSGGLTDLATKAGNSHVREKNYREAIREYNEAFIRNNSAAACYNLAVLYDFELGFLQKAVFFYEKFLDMAPHHEKAGQAAEWKSQARDTLNRRKGHFYKGSAFKLRQPEE